MGHIKAVIFDLDDTLYNHDLIIQTGLKQAVQVMIEKGLKTSLDKGVSKINEIIKNNLRKDKFRELAKFYNQEDDELIEAGYNRYINSDFEELEIYPGTKEVLGKLKGKFKIILVTKGSVDQQNKKIDVLGIRDYFDHVFINDDKTKIKDMQKVIDLVKLKPEEILIVGDNISNEIKIGNDLGMKTVRIMKGKYRDLEPIDDSEKPDYVINNLDEILDILK